MTSTFLESFEIKLWEERKSFLFHSPITTNKENEAAHFEYSDNPNVLTLPHSQYKVLTKWLSELAESLSLVTFHQRVETFLATWHGPVTQFCFQREESHLVVMVVGKGWRDVFFFGKMIKWGWAWMWYLEMQHSFCDHRLYTEDGEAKDEVFGHGWQL